MALDGIGPDGERSVMRRRGPFARVSLGNHRRRCEATAWSKRTVTFRSGSRPFP
jgi:hypothetical protein